MSDKYLGRSGSTAYRIINGAAVIVGAPEGKLRTLNKVGTFIWDLADGGHTLADITDRVCREFEVDPATAARDTGAFVRDLEGKNMLVLTDSPVSPVIKP